MALVLVLRLLPAAVPHRVLVAVLAVAAHLVLAVVLHLLPGAVLLLALGVGLVVAPGLVLEVELDRVPHLAPVVVAHRVLVGALRVGLAAVAHLVLAVV